MGVLATLGGFLYAVVSVLSPIQWLGAIGVVGLLVYWHFTKNFGQFEKLGLHSVKPEFLFGNDRPIILQTDGSMNHYIRFYQHFKEHKYGIYYEGSKPALFVCDPELIKQVTIKDFDHFIDFGFVPAEILKIKGNGLGLANTRGKEWKALRTSITPAFSLKNMKRMALRMHQPAQDAVGYAQKSQDGIVNIEKLTGYFAMDCIGRIVYSLDFNCGKADGNDFIRHGENMLSMWRFALSTMLPKVASWLQIPFMNPEPMRFFENNTRKVLKDRDQRPKQDWPSDILGLMMKIRDQDDDILEGQKPNPSSNYMTNTMIADTLMQFFFDGYDTVGAMNTMCFYFLALNPEIQERAMEEVDALSDKVGGEISGEDVNELKYLEKVFLETTRMAPFPITMRECTKPWTIPGTNVTIPEGMKVLIPIAGIQTDPKYFPEPHRFDPERFSPENKGQIVPGTFLPFGMGPRQCIGMKIAQMESKILMYQILRNFHLEPCEKTVIPIEWKKDHFNRIQGGCYLKLVPRSS